METDMTPRIVDKEEKRRVLIEAAADVFAEQGFSGTTVAHVAEHAAVGKGTLYEYFDTKDALFFAVFEVFVDEIDQRLEALAGGEGSAEDRLRLMIDGAVEMIVEGLDAYGLTMEFWAASAAGPNAERLTGMFRTTYRRLRRLVAEVISAGQRRGDVDADVDPEAVAAGLVGALDALGLQLWFDREIDPRRIAGGFGDVVIRGLGPR